MVGGSYGGTIAGHMAAKAGALAIVLNDTGLGMDDAGISPLPYLNEIGMAAVTVGHMTAHIGDRADLLERGRISHANAIATAVVVQRGQSCRDAVALLTTAPVPTAAPSDCGEARFLLFQDGDGPEV